MSPHIAAIGANGYAESLQICARADAREHQQLRRAERAGRQHDFAAGGERELLRRAVRQTRQNSTTARALELEPLDERAGVDRQVGARSHRMQEGARTAPAPPAALGNLGFCGALLTLAVVIRIAGQPEFGRCIDEYGT